MRVAAEQLPQRLQASFPPVIVLHGDETFLIEEAADAVRRVARQKGITERQVWHAEGRFDWSRVRFDGDNLSLFAQQKLLEIRLPGAAPGKDGGEVLKQFAESPAPDTYLLLISGKLSTVQQKTKWFAALDKRGFHVPIWPVSAEQLPAWIDNRLRKLNLRADRSVAHLIAERVEGHLHAAAQEVEKLALLFPNGAITEQNVLSSVADSSRFDAFTLADAVVAGQQYKVPRMLRSIQAEGSDVMSVTSGLGWSLRRWVDMALHLAQGQSAQHIFEQQKPPVWEKARPQTLALLKRHTPRQWQAFLRKMALIDQTAKGSAAEDPWRLLEQLCVEMAGHQPR